MVGPTPRRRRTRSTVGDRPPAATDDGADAAAVDAVLQRLWPRAACELSTRDAWELLVAAVLSARTTDLRVNQQLPVIFEHFAGPEAFAAASPLALEKRLRRIPLAAQKARHLHEAARVILRDHGGRVPEDLAALRRLPGLGAKTAAVVAGNAFGIPAVAADVHVQRIVRRLGWTTAEDPVAAAAAIEARFPPRRWVRICHQLIRLGREHCRAVARCAGCPLRGDCPQRGVAARPDGGAG